MSGKSFQEHQIAPLHFEPLMYQGIEGLEPS
ncbi:hypothetical protein CPL00220_CDS0109 [Escherichia phage Baret]